MEERNQKKNSGSFTRKVRESADGIKHKLRKDPTAPKKTPNTQKEKGRAKKVWFWVGTVCLVGVLTLAIFAGFFMIYINTVLKGHVEVDVSEYTQEISTELYYQEPSSEEWTMYQTLFANENRILVDSEQIPEHLKQATIAIEDKRFESHHGVDWRGTLRAILSTVTGSGVQGGSTITQQMIKNVTGNNENTVKRKITEIYRALALEEDYTKDEILTIYLNTVYLGNQCYGVQTAADMYFAKDVSELTLAESACLISITNNPSQFDPLRADWCREENRSRQLLVLEAMLDQHKIDQATYEAAVAEEVVFTNGYTNLGNKVAAPSEEEKPAVVSTANNSYFTDQVIDDVADALVELYNLGDDPADADGYVRTAHEKAVSMVYSKGLKIYTTQNPKYQKMAEEVFENTSYQDYTDSVGEPLQAGITVMDPFTGNIVAMVGGTGAKEYDRSWNWASAVRQCGSAIKPISTYAPALDDGTITAASAIDDYPIYLPGYGAYPKNSYGTFDGMSSVQDALRWSSNCCAVRVNQKYGTPASYNFMTEKLGFTTLTPTDSEQVGNMALGGLEYGVTTVEMAAAFSSFVNDGIYTEPRTFVRVEDSNGQVLIDNKPESHVAMKETTAYLMRDMLQTVVSSGTGTEADFSGMSTAGKTGTTDANRDRYFVGFTPYYCAAVWTGYKSNDVVDVSGNPSANLWREVMSRIHADLENPGFHSASGLVEVTVCADSGLLATDACSKDIRGGRARTVLVAADTAPTQSCNMHKMISYCEKGKHIATDFCPKKDVKEVAVLDHTRSMSDGSRVTAKDDEYLLETLTKDPVCPAHKKPIIIDPPKPEKPDEGEDDKKPDVKPDPEVPPEEKPEPEVPPEGGGTEETSLLGMWGLLFAMRESPW